MKKSVRSAFRAHPYKTSSFADLLYSLVKTACNVPRVQWVKRFLSANIKNNDGLYGSQGIRTRG